MKPFSQFISEATDPKGPIKKYMSPEEIVKKHKITMDALNSQLEMGIKVESEHTGSKKMARMIALQHLEELPDYYSRLKKAEKIKEETASGDETLGDWFRKSSATDPKTGRKVPGWRQLGGKYAGAPCARQPGQTSTPKCGSSKMAANLSDDEEDKAFRRKNRKDPNQPEKTGAAKPTNVATEETIIEKKDACYSKVKSRYSVWPSAYASGALVKCRKVGAANWGNKTKKESYDYSNWRDEFKPVEYIFTDIIKPSPLRGSSVEENYSFIQSRGTTYGIMLNWRGKTLGVQIFFPQFTRPSKEQVSFEINKIYPGAIVLSWKPTPKDPTKPLLFTGEQNGSVQNNPRKPK
jgi:hypothetical protein